MGIAQSICKTNAKLAINTEKISIQRRAGACSRRFLYTLFTYAGKVQLNSLQCRLCRLQNHLRKMLVFSLSKILHVPIWMKHRATLAVSSKYFDTFIYTFIVIYKSLKILIHTVFSLLSYSVPYKFYSKKMPLLYYSEKMTS